MLTSILAGAIFLTNNLHSLPSHVGEFFASVLLLPAALVFVLLGVPGDFLAWLSCFPEMAIVRLNDRRRLFLQRGPNDVDLDHDPLGEPQDRCKRACLAGASLRFCCFRGRLEAANRLKSIAQGFSPGLVRNKNRPESGDRMGVLRGYAS
jgi:hypothetical protein